MARLQQQSERRTQLLNKVRNIISRHAKGLPVRVFLYGSWARGEERITSDIDVAIWSEQPLPTGMLSALKEELEESSIPYRVEVIELREAVEAFIKRVIKEGIEWIDCDNV